MLGNRMPGAMFSTFPLEEQPERARKKLVT